MAMRYILLALAFILPADAHDWFTGLTDPVLKMGCCNDTDCNSVPKEMLDSGAITEVPGGFRVNLSLLQARHFNRYATMPISEFIPEERVQPGLSSGFALCVYSSKQFEASGDYMHGYYGAGSPYVPPKPKRPEDYINRIGCFFRASNT